MTTLETWRRDAGISAVELARRLGVSGNAGRRYCAGERIPRRETMARIWTVTGGAVDPNSFYDLPALPTKKGGWTWILPPWFTWPRRAVREAAE